MPLPRKRIVSLADTPYYHCISRCVRRAYLCGEDKYSGKSYEHRREWVEKSLLRLAQILRAIMDTHINYRNTAFEEGSVE